MQLDIDEDDSLERFGLAPTKADLPTIRCILESHADAERERQGKGDTELLKLSCVQLFNSGGLNDVLLIWDAKTSSSDADASIEIQLLCGAGLEKTLQFLEEEGSEQANAARSRLEVCLAAGDFEDFDVSRQTDFYTEYYGD